MMCPRCHSYNTSAQIVTDSQLVTAHHGIIWWLLIGWWWVPFKWLMFTIPALLVKIFVPRRQKLRQRHRSYFVCHDCGHHWQA